VLGSLSVDGIGELMQRCIMDTDELSRRYAARLRKEVRERENYTRHPAMRMLTLWNAMKELGEELERDGFADAASRLRAALEQWRG